MIQRIISKVHDFRWRATLCQLVDHPEFGFLGHFVDEPLILGVSESQGAASPCTALCALPIRPIFPPRGMTAPPIRNQHRVRRQSSLITEAETPAMMKPGPPSSLSRH